MEFIDQNLYQFLLAAAGLVVGGAMVLGWRWYKSDDGVARFFSENEAVINIIFNIVIAIGKGTSVITQKEWLLYEQEALQRGLDARLVAAARETEQALKHYGINFPIKLLLNLVEGEYQRLKKAGFFDEE